MDFVSVLAWFGALLAGIVLTVVLQGRVQWVLAKVLGGIVPRGPRNVQGLWQAKYIYFTRDGVERVEHHLLELQQFGKYARGCNLVGKKHWYNVSGRLENEIYLTGSWRNTSEGDLFHGAFQFVVNPEGDEMKGLWIGFNTDHKVKHGPWEWKLIDREINRRSRDRARKSHFDGTPVDAGT